MVRQSAAGFLAAVVTLGGFGARVARPETGRTGVGTAVSGPTVRLAVAPEGNEARYRVREQLANIDFPTDAIGASDGVTGALVFDDHGTLLPDSSRIVVDLTRLKSDKERRDRYIQGRTLQTDQFPTAVLVPTELRGAPAPLPASGPLKFVLVGNLTIHGVTRPTTWEVTGTAAGGGYMGTAHTAFTFQDFGLEPPRLAFLLSVADTIRLEYDFHLVKQ